MKITQARCVKGLVPDTSGADCLAYLALWMKPRSIPVNRWSWRTDAPSRLS